jgi:hypothetical protein
MNKKKFLPFFLYLFLILIVILSITYYLISYNLVELLNKLDGFLDFLVLACGASCFILFTYLIINYLLFYFKFKILILLPKDRSNNRSNTIFISVLYIISLTIFIIVPKFAYLILIISTSGLLVIHLASYLTENVVTEKGILYKGSITLWNNITQWNFDTEKKILYLDCLIKMFFIKNKYKFTLDLSTLSDDDINKIIISHLPNN